MLERATYDTNLQHKSHNYSKNKITTLQIKWRYRLLQNGLYNLEFFIHLIKTQYCLIHLNVLNCEFDSCSKKFMNHVSDVIITLLTFFKLITKGNNPINYEPVLSRKPVVELF